jgi:methionyl-tRNA synthetase
MERVLITATPPTPNGDLHVGHLSGPYLAADVYKRWCRLAGREACFITGGDDNQSYVAAKAEQLGAAPAAVAERFDGTIVDTLRRARIEADVYVRPLSSPRHARFVAEFVRRLHDGGHLVARETDASWCGHCQRFLFEAWVTGTCPHCGAHSDGSCCESCAQPNQCTDLLGATCKRCGSPALRRPVRRLFFPLAPHAQRLRGYLSGATMGSHLAALWDTMLGEGLPEIPITHPADWGIPAPVPGFDGQRLYAWFEMAPGYLSATQEMLAERGLDGSWEDWWRSDGASVVQFFGYDNAYFHTLLFTAEMMAYDPQIRLPAAFVSNEFYRLDGEKFSTSRSHAIWGKEALDHLPADALRYYLCRDRPETEQTNFRLRDFRDTAARELAGRWQPWLLRLARKVRGEFDGFVPEKAEPSAGQARFAAELAELVRTAARAYREDAFSPRRVVAACDGLVRAASDFGAGEAFWRREALDRRRTAAALELAAAATLAALVSPVMPDFGARLWSELGFAAPLGPGDWPAGPVTVPAGQRLNGMESPYFAGIDAGCDALEAARAARAERAGGAPGGAMAAA